MSQLLVLSTYELGTRPLGCTVPAALLSGAGHEVVAADLALEDFPAAALAETDGVVLSVPMHTAWRLGGDVLAAVRAARPDVPVFLHGLYAEAAASSAGSLLCPGDLAIAGEIAEALTTWAAELGRHRPPPACRVELGPARPAPRPPQRRSGLPGLAAYARLRRDGEEHLVGTVEATTGCNHTCRHCPVPVVYAGRSRPVAPATVLAEIDQLVAEGAAHIHFADPDFLNRPAHAREIAAALHRAHPAVSFDATVKVSHLLRDADHLGELARHGLVFVTTALESTSDLVLERLDKGHTSAEARHALRLLRSAGIEPRPSFLPFTPWTTPDDVIALFDFVAEEDLVWNVDPVQFGIRLLLPPGSLLLRGDDPVLAASLLGPDPANGGTAWRAGDRALDTCQVLLARGAEELETAGAAPPEAYAHLRALAHGALGRSERGVPDVLVSGAPAGATRPRLTETWFCCAEPTATQIAGVAPCGGGSS